MEIPKEKLLEMYRNLLTARLLDVKMFEMYSAGGTGLAWVHRGTGEEAIPIAFLANLRKDDYFKPNFRTLFCNFAKGLSLRDVIATECQRAVVKAGGHPSRFSLEYGLLDSSGSLGEDVAIYVGAALSVKLRKTDQVAVCIFGDGAANRGPVHEAMVMAAFLKLPIVFVIQNNQYAVSMPSHKAYAIKDLSDRAKGYGFPGQTVDGNDIIAVYEVAKEYIDRARSGGGPGLIVAETYRLGGHFPGDPQIYRPKGEVEEWWEKDPLPRYCKSLMEIGVLTEGDVIRLDEEIKAEVDAAGEAAQQVPFPTMEDYVKTAVAEL